jgi:hypothetical protein
MTDAVQAERLAALRTRRATNPSGARPRPAEAARVLVAGVGTAAALTMVAAMARADKVVAVTETTMVPVIAEEPPLQASVDARPAPATSSPSTVTPARTVPPVQTVTVTPAKAVTVSRPAPTATNTRTNGSR